MTFEIDHIFVCAAAGGFEAERLIAFGLTEGSPNTHPGQGTACRRFFFENAYLEFLWVQAPVEAQSEASRPTRLWERCSERIGSTCPFGICVRPPDHQAGDRPFATWDYRPTYLPPGTGLSIAKNSEVITEPMLIYMESGQRPDSYPTDRQQPLKHAAGLREITRMSLVSPHAKGTSPEFQAVIDAKLVELRTGDNHYVEIGFDGESQGNRNDFRPALPLIFRW